jgi:F-type H+-transporting ATPase subunit epsilon
MTNLKMEIVTPDRKVLGKEIKSLVVPASDGYVGILPGHAPLVTSLGIGVLNYKSDEENDLIAISGGFMEVSENKISIMADTAECCSEIDLERAKRAEQRARERLKQQKTDIDFVRAEKALKRALARQSAAEKGQR